MRIIILKPTVKIAILSVIVVATLLCLSLLGVDMSLRNLAFLALTLLLVSSLRAIKNAVVQGVKDRLARQAWTKLMKGGSNGKS